MLGKNFGKARILKHFVQTAMPDNSLPCTHSVIMPIAKQLTWGTLEAQQLPLESEAMWWF